MKGTSTSPAVVAWSVIVYVHVSVSMYVVYVVYVVHVVYVLYAVYVVSESKYRFQQYSPRCSCGCAASSEPCVCCSVSKSLKD